MNIVTPYAKISHSGLQTRECGIELLRKIENIGRVSHRSEDKQTETSWERFISAVVLKHGDWSITEHVSVTVEALVDRGITHEWVRHRIGAYTQESTRFVKYGNEVDVIAPMNATDTGYNDWYYVVNESSKYYNQLIYHGVKPQIARSLLPNALAAKLIVTYNLRNWRHFFLMRTTQESHPAMREVAIPLLQEFQEKIPLLYDDIEPNARQINNLSKPR